MITVLVGLLVVLLGARLRLRPPARRPPTRAVLDARPCATDPALADLSPATPTPVDPGEPDAVHGWRPHDWRPLVARRSIHRTTEPGPEHVATWCDDLARAVGSGATLPTAVATVEPPSTCVPAVDSIRLALARGAPLHDSCAPEDHPPALQVALTVIRACATQGGPAGEPLSRAAAILRGRAADAAERRTHSAQARLSAFVMTILPLCMLLLLVLTSGSVRRFVTTPLGLCVVASGAALNAIGWRWMRHLTNGGRP